jgi:hypothetical protein
MTTSDVLRRSAGAGQLLAARVAPGSQVIIIAASKDDNPKVTMLLVPDGAHQPTVAVKLAMTDRAGQSVLREAAFLSSLDRSQLGAAESTVPRLLAVLEHQGLPAMVTDVLLGTPMSVAYHAWRHTGRQALVEKDFATARAWLRCLRRQETTSTDRRDPWSCLLSDRWPDRSELSPVLGPLREIEASLTSSLGAVVHGDFWCGNILASGSRVSGVVDWEHADAIGNPLRDWARFVLSYSLYLDRHTRQGHPVAGHRGLRAGRWGDGLRWALTGRGWYPDLVQRFLTEAVESLGLPAQLWRAAALLGLAEIAIRSDQDSFAQLHLSLLSELLATSGVAR